MDVPLPLDLASQSRRCFSLDRRSAYTRFDGIHQKTSNWNGFHRDPDMWSPGTSCSIHFYAQGASRRGPSLKLSLAMVEALESEYLLEHCLHVRGSSAFLPPLSEVPSNSEFENASLISKVSDSLLYEFYIPTPAGLPREAAYAYHVTTRNCFALATSIPIVGETLAGALLSLWDRLLEWNAVSVTPERFLDYCKEQGYLDFTGHANHALALLAVAEHAHIRSLWTDAFAHCVGMHSQLPESLEFYSISDSTRSLITRAAMEMEVHINTAIHAIGHLLEDELAFEKLAMSKPAQDHLDRFRSWLTNFYIESIGYFPPTRTSQPWDKQPWIAMYNSFRALYDYLADQSSSPEPAIAENIQDGIFLTKAIKAFNDRHSYLPLPHALPLLPGTSSKSPKKLSHKGFRTLMLGRSDPRSNQETLHRELEEATRSDDAEILSNQLVLEYRRFERRPLTERLTIAEGRQIRWILVYGMLQVLISITCAPKEVRNTENKPYPLCVLMADSPPWSSPEPSIHSERADSLEPVSKPAAIPEEVSTTEVSPLNDFEAEFALPQPVAPLRVPTKVSRTALIRSTVQSSIQTFHKSVARSLSRSSWRSHNARSESVPAVQRDGGVPSATRAASTAPYQARFSVVTNSDEGESEPVTPLSHTENRTFDGSVHTHSNRSATHSTWSTVSETSSVFSGAVESPATEVSSSWGDEGSNHGVESTDKAQVTMRVVSVSHSRSATGTREASVEETVPLKTLGPRAVSSESLRSSAGSSIYPEDNIQAAEIEEEDLRGRRRSRGLDMLTEADLVSTGREDLYLD